MASSPAAALQIASSIIHSQGGAATHGTHTLHNMSADGNKLMK